MTNVLLIAAFASPAASADVRHFEYRGLKLGISVEDAVRIVGGELTEKRDEQFGVLLEYELIKRDGRFSDPNRSYLSLTFSRDGYLMYISDSQNFAGTMNLNKLAQRYSQKFGVPHEMNTPVNEMADKEKSFRLDWFLPGCGKICAAMTVVGEVNLTSQTGTEKETYIGVSIRDIEKMNESTRENEKIITELEKEKEENKKRKKEKEIYRKEHLDEEVKM